MRLEIKKQIIDDVKSDLIESLKELLEYQQENELNRVNIADFIEKTEEIQRVYKIMESLFFLGCDGQLISEKFDIIND